jgi:cathepsin H
MYFTIAAAAAVAVYCLLNVSAPLNGSNFLQTIDPVDQVFIRYLSKEGKSYATKEEFERRKQIFSASLKFVTEHNSRNDATYTVKLNHFSDLTTEEINKYFLGDSGEPEVYLPEDQQTTPSLEQVQVKPIDWRDFGIVGPVKDQGKCGSCWSFSTAGPIEQHYALKYNRSIVVAEQQLVDCSWAFGNDGCNGGLFANGYAYVKQFGLMAEQSYPYVAKDT